MPEKGWKTITVPAALHIFLSELSKETGKPIGELIAERFTEYRDFRRTTIDAEG